MKRIALCLILLASLPLLAAKQREWHTGKLVSMTQTHTDINNSTTINHVEIDAGDVTYFADQFMKFAWNHSPKLTENSEVKWAVDNNDFYLIDEAGKEFKLKLIKKRKN